METTDIFCEKGPLSLPKQLWLEQVVNAVIADLRLNHKFAAVRTYGSTLRSVIKFMGHEGEPPTAQGLFRPGTLKQYQEWLRRHKATWGTVSTYMRTLHAVYNRLVESDTMAYVPRLFANVYTKVESNTKRALTKEQMETLLAADTSRMPAPIRSALAYFLLTFLLRGMPFIDLAHLQKKDLKNNRIVYCRHKTGRRMSVRIPAHALPLLEEFRNSNPCSIYLFPILEAEAKGGKCFCRNTSSEEVHECYLRALRRYNKLLVQVAALLLPDARLSSYTPRHTWATLAFYKGITIGIISKALGHSSSKVTEIYLKPFDDEKVDIANDELIASFVKSSLMMGFESVRC